MAPTPQPGIFAAALAEHVYLELDRRTSREDLVKALNAVGEPMPAAGAINVVAGIRPSLWGGGAEDFTEPVVGPDGFTMPATQHDAWLWLAGADRTALFDYTRAAFAVLDPVATVATEVTGWVYHHDRDLTGFIDGTENPPRSLAPGVATHEGTGIALVQQWRHDTGAFDALTERQQELVIGRTKADSVELDEDHQPPTSHVSRTVIEQDGEELKIFRRNTAYGTVRDHGTMFVGFCASQYPLAEMLRRMAGVGDGVRDALTRYTTPLTGAYYVIPPVEALAAFG
ncbi:Dyp-type peroxidase [Dactylosporangium sp. AC04546]|uniref:Dyp-type peroxidase n=1 Tax=Dactylosporangium sp. AC04546 TaxID=2862460 RepID=UPI001EDE5566|nr:Dyp-type peroxidase [Dactylosporangium sp. AC04546]WVK81881.1 Dyp-type peroxidase [Dactylosporangium sp. AC04546]